MKSYDNRCPPYVQKSRSQKQSQNYKSSEEYKIIAEIEYRQNKLE